MKLFFKTLALILLPILIVFLISYSLLKNSMDSSFEKYIKTDTKAKFEMIKHDFINKNINRKKLYKLYSNIYKKTFLRITLIKPNGKVIFDSSIPFKEIDKLENHKYRPEVQKAFKNGNGFSERFSKTKKMFMLYYAKILPNGNILRISYPLTYIKKVKKGFESGLYIVFFLTLLMITLISALIARKLSFPIQKLNYIVDAIKSGKNIHFPKFKDENLSKAAALIYDIYKAMESKQKEVEIEKQKLDNILEFIEEGVVLLSGELSYIHSNAKFNAMFNIQPETNKNILSSIKDHEILAVFSEILEKRKDAIVKIKDRNYKVYCKNLDEYLLVVFDDVEEKIQYEYFKSELVGNISHELKTPISSLSAYAETLLINDDLDSKTQKEFIKKIYESSIRLSSLLNDIIELHRLENFAMRQNRDEIDLDVIKKELQELYKNSNKTVYLDFKEKKIKIIREHLMSVLTNLIDNAIKYSTGNGVYVKIEKSNSKIHIVVDDEGPAIEGKERERIFERFYTCSKSRNKQKSGSGLGLSIVKHISFLYQGVVKLEQNPAGGNRFIVIIPDNSTVKQKVSE